MSSNNIVIREGVKSDCKEIRQFIQELADFEKMSDGPKIGYETLERDGFENNPPLFSVYVAEDLNGLAGEEDRKLVGYALYYYTYSTWNGRRIYLEDLYVTEKYRNLRIGTRLFQAVAKKTVEDGCAYLDFCVLTWNPARKFYERLGAVNISKEEEWNIYRLKDEALKEVTKSSV